MHGLVVRKQKTPEKLVILNESHAPIGKVRKAQLRATLEPTRARVGSEENG
jgi:hypothetical protein